MVHCRIKVSKKGKRWPKGQSSNSNPVSKRHRSLAQQGYFMPDKSKESTLTINALKKHDQIMVSNSSLNSMDASNSVHSLNDMETESYYSGTVQTSDTFASTFSTCTNTSFSKFLNNFNSQSAKQKAMLAVLAGITDAIKSNDGTESTVEYFGALMTTLEQMSGENERNDETVAAVLSLLSMCIKSVSRPILQLKYSAISKIISTYWLLYAESNDNVILQSIMKCLARLQMAQEAAVWTDSSTVSMYNRILLFVIHAKPKIRKAAQRAVCSILKGSLLFKDDPNIIFHPMAKRTGTYFTEMLENCISNGEVTQTLHILNLLQEILGSFHETHIKTCCEQMLKLMTLGNMLVNSCCLRTLHGMLCSRPDIKRFSVELNTNLIAALYDYQPATSNSQMMLSWLMVMQEAFINLSKNDLSRCLTSLPKFVEICMESLKSENSNVINNSSFVMEALIKDCIGSTSASENVDNYLESIQDIFSIIDGCLQPSYCNAWRQVFFLIRTFIMASNDRYYEFMMPCLKKLADYRDGDDFPFKNELDQVFASAIQIFGPGIVIQEIPIQVIFQNSHYQFKRSWLLPIMKDNIKKATLKCFNDSFLPIATYCWNVCAPLKGAMNSIPAICYDLLQCQIWALLPSFCTHASDISTTFPVMAKALGTALRTRKDLSITILTSLRRLIQRGKDNEDDLLVVAKFAKNYLPILFNIYTTTPKQNNGDESVRSSTFKTIEAYLTITDQVIRTDLYNNAIKKLESPDEVDDSKFVEKSLFDLIKLLLPYQNSDSIKSLYNTYISHVLDKKDREQKKRFRLLQTILNSKTESCNEFVQAYLSEIRQLLLESMQKASVITRGARIQCLIGLFDYDSSKSTLIEIIPEAVLCCKDINSQCRKSAMMLLVKLYSVASQIGEQMDFFNCIMAGLVGSVNMINSTLIALTSLTFRFKDKIDPDQLITILKSVCLLCSSSTREIVGHALSFIKSSITTFPNHVSCNLPMIVKSLSGVTERCRNGLRRRLHFIYVRLVRKFGVDTIASFVPNEDQKTLRKLRTIRKSQNRNMKKAAKKAVLREEKTDEDDNRSEFSFKSATSKVKTMDDILAECDDDDDDDGDDEDDDIKSAGKKRNKKMKKKRGVGISLREDPDSIMDFTDNTINKNISIMDETERKRSDRCRTAGKAKKKDGRFKLASDGRLIITEEVEERASRKQPSRSDDNDVNYIGNANDDDDDGGDKSDEALSDMISQLGVTGKRKGGTVISDGPASKYRPGGSGIHRNVKNTNKKKKNEANDKERHTGAQYKTSKAKGDMKKKGLPDPFAYIPLKRNMLNKRKRKKTSAEFRNIIRGAKKGAAIGMKEKAKNKKRKMRNVKFY